MRPVLVGLLAIVAAATAAGCGDDQPSTEGFCQRLAEQLPQLVAAPAGTDVDVLVERYHDLGELAPLAIAQDWATITDLVETSAELDLTDPAAVDALRVQSLAVAPAATRLQTFARQECGVELDSLGVPPAASTPDTATTVPAPGSLPPPAP